MFWKERFPFQICGSLNARKILETPYTNQKASRKPEEKARLVFIQVSLFS